MNTENRFAREVLEIMSKDLEEVSFREVLWCGKLNDSGLISEIHVAARGTEEEVPALFPHMEKGDVVIHNHPSGVLQPSAADLSIASSLGNQGIGFYIVNNELTRYFGVAEPVKKKRNSNLSVEDLAFVLSPGGALSQSNHHYEHRPSQTALLKMISEGFNNNQIIAAEAGTGVGKSFAYLIPAITWAEENEERVVISTATINLQQQIVEKDIPFVKRLIGSQLKAVLVKGRRNYVCLSRLHEQLEENSLFMDDSDPLNIIFQWTNSSATGSRSELNFLPDESLWSKICSESDTCSGMRCRWYEDCFVMKARREASSAGLLVVNHHLLFADLSLRMSGMGYDSGAVLPVYDRIVFDEAHNIEQSATSFFSESISRFSISQLLSRLYRQKRKKTAGAAVRLESITGPLTDLVELPQLVNNVKVKADLLDSICRDFTGDDYSRRVTEQMGENLQSGVLNPMGELQRSILQLTELCSDILKSIPQEEEENALVFEYKAVIKRLQDVASFCEKFRNYSEYGDLVFWIERKRTSAGDYFERFIITPLEISSLMNEAVFSQFKGIVCTSATLTVKDNFHFWNNRVGLSFADPERLRTKIFPSPFDYERRVLLGVPTDAPLPESQKEYYDFIINYCDKVLELTEGSALLLFTSYEMLKNVHEHLQPILSKRGITSFRQGEDDRTRLLNSFRDDISSVLFATDSFWEGVDTPGDSLKCVIICRLPFKVPSDPVIKARMEAIERRGGNSFMDLSLPEAVMKFKQGFGRLMRRQTDRGVVLILDSRVVKKRYGSIFINSLPPAKKSIKEGENLLSEIENFLYGN